ncbi:MAG: helix-turn-helix transcriptional regulator [Erysipelotrichaceae bacterium]|nr:helix-turn-helix transcriptional regulator [Erysipelotrichaceae bacterium]
MKLSDKILNLRKKQGMSQEELADALGVSRQAVSRWEVGTALPDATNILQLSKLFQVTTDYLLHDEYQSDNDLPKVQESKQENIKQIFILLITLEVMVVLMQFMSLIILQSVFFTVLSCIPFVAIIGGFEYAYQRNGNERSRAFRQKFYHASTWLGLYFPVRLLCTTLSIFYPRPYSVLTFEIVVLVVYLASVILIKLFLLKENISSEE